MNTEINLMANYPVAKRDLSERADIKTEEDRGIARRFDKEFFDGNRKYGYGGYNYLPRFWENIIPDFLEYYQLRPESKILDVGCGKGFMLYDFMRLIPGLPVAGIDISKYAINNAKKEVQGFSSGRECY